jgi:hypothetical protein
MFQSIFPPAIVREHRQEKPSKVSSARFSNDEILGRALFRSTNKLKGKDGRTYNYIDKNGEYVSSRISPYSPYIDDNIEPGVYDIVKSLLNKGYLTVSSCQGHSDRKFRFVTVAFKTQQNSDEFKDVLINSKVPLHFQKVSKNTGFSFVYDQNRYNGKELAGEEYRNVPYSESDLVKYLNIMFLRNYSEYHLLQVRIASEPDIESVGILKYILSKPYYFVLYQFRDYFTKKLVSYINTYLKDYSDKL